jgi:PilZ domain
MRLQTLGYSARDGAGFCNADQGMEKRKERRYPTNDAADVKLLPDDGKHLPGTIIDISKSGLRLELSTGLTKGRRIEIITFPAGLIIFGEVKYCRRVGAVFHAGVQIEGVVSKRDDGEAHILDEEIELYVVGKGLTAPELLRVREHLSKCDVCCRRVLATAAMLQPRRFRPVLRQ